MKRKIVTASLLWAAIMLAAECGESMPLTAAVDTTGTVTAPVRHGFFNIQQVNDRYLFEIPDSLLGRDILVVSRLIKANAGSGANGDDQLEMGRGGEGKILRFEKGRGSKIHLDTVSYAVLNDPASPLYAAVSNSNVQIVAATFDIKARSANNSASIIDMTDQITGGGCLVNGAASQINAVIPHPSSVEIIAARAVQGGTADINTSLILLSKEPMPARLFDERVGYFATAPHTVFEEKGVRKVSFVCRWRLEPREEDREKYNRGELVEPKKPIIVYIDPATPEKWVPYLIQGVNDWQPALEKAGFKNAIIGKRAPAPEEDSSWSLASCPAAIVYKASAEDNAKGPHIHDPRSGEIIQSHIEWYHNILKLAHDRYMIQACPSDPAGRAMTFNDTLTGELIRVIASHEVGHLLGLRHNLGASFAVPVDKLRNKAWVEANGHTPSIMDYSRFNYVAQPEDGISRKGMLPRIGVYDRWAVEWGYRLFPGYKNGEEEAAGMNGWVRKKLEDPRLWWGNGEWDGSNFTDPRAQPEDLGDNAVKAGDYGIRNLQRVVVPGLLRWTSEPGGNFDNLADMYHCIIGSVSSGAPTGQYNQYISSVIKLIGGVYKTQRVTEDNRPVYAYVPAGEQRAAVDFLNRQLFTTPLWLLDTAILGRTGDDPVKLIGTAQNGALNLLFRNALYSLQSAVPLAGPGAYTPGMLLDDMKKGIWSELAAHSPVDIYRRRLQKNYVYLLCELSSATQDNSDVPAVVSAHLTALRAEITRALPVITETITRTHLQEVIKRINVCLDTSRRK